MKACGAAEGDAAAFAAEFSANRAFFYADGLYGMGPLSLRRETMCVSFLVVQCH